MGGMEYLITVICEEITEGGVQTALKRLRGDLTCRLFALLQHKRAQQWRPWRTEPLLLSWTVMSSSIHGVHSLSRFLTPSEDLSFLTSE